MSRRVYFGAPRFDCLDLFWFASGFNGALCANFMAQRQGSGVRFHQGRNTKQIVELNDLRKEYKRVRKFINVSSALISN